MISCDQNDDNGISNLEERESKCILIHGWYSFIESGEIVENEETYDFKMLEYHKDWYEYYNSEIKLDEKNHLYWRR